MTSVSVCLQVSWPDADAAIRRLCFRTLVSCKHSSRLGARAALYIMWCLSCAPQTSHRKRKFIQQCLQCAKVHRGRTHLCFYSLQPYLALWLCFVSVLSQWSKVVQTGHMSVHKPNKTARWLVSARQKSAKASALVYLTIQPSQY